MNLKALRAEIRERVTRRTHSREFQFDEEIVKQQSQNLKNTI